MKIEDRYLKYVRWSEEDAIYVGYCPDLFPWGGVCHAPTEEEAYHQLGELVRGEITDLANSNQPFPEPATRPMREAVSA
jgi:predicted RNase H-like HicB family nuclease